MSLFVVKLGGEVVAGPELPAIAADVRALVDAGHRVVMVHGGGPQATALQRALGQEPRQIAGRRVTDEAALDVMKMVVAGKLNVDLCGALVRAGVTPLGLHGASGRVIVATKRPPKVYAGAGPDPVDLGLVGDVARVDTGFLGRALELGCVPVLACLGVGDDGQAYNINADIVATRVAAELEADGLFLVSDVRGVLRDVADASSRIATLTIEEGRRLVADGVVTKGMIVKLEEAFSALAAGVRRIHVLGKIAPGELAREAGAPGSVGTALVP